MKYNEVKNCKYSTQDGTRLDCEVLFETLGWVPFTAVAEDSTYSGEIYSRALNGDFGPIAPYQAVEINSIPITQSDMVRNKRNSLLTNLDRTISNPLRWASFSQQEQADFAQYRQALLDVPQQPGFPELVTWPQPPANLVEPPPVTINIVA